MKYTVSVDLGSLSDYTAITVLEEKAERVPQPSMSDIRNRLEGPVVVRTTYNLNWMERPELRTPYDRIIERVKAIMDSPKIKDDAVLLVDATGVGRPVVDMMVRVGLSPVPITITGGTATTFTDNGYHVPKRDLAGALQVMFSTRRIRMSPKLLLGEVFLKEMSTFAIKISKAGNDTYEAWREQDHDDLVLSVAMGAWFVLMTNPIAPRFQDLTLEGLAEKPYDPFSYLDE